MFVSGTVTEAIAKSEQLSWPLLLFVVDGSQLDVCEQLIRDAGLESMAVMQLILVDTPEHAQFQAMTQETMTPRVHIFAPKGTRDPALPPLALGGSNFTADRVAEAVSIATEWSSAFTDNLVRRALSQVPRIEEEARRFRDEQDSRLLKTAVIPPSGSANRPTSAKGEAASRSSTAASASPQAQGPGAGSHNVSRKPADAHSHAAIQHYVELSINDKIDVIFSHDPAMTLAHLWDTASGRALPRSVLTQLVIEDPNTSVLRHIKSRDEAAECPLSSLANRSHVVAKFETESAVVCDGGVCRRVSAEPTRATIESTAAAAGRKVESPLSPSPSSGSVTIRVTLPDGGYFSVSGLSGDSVFEEVWRAAAAHIGHEEFTLYNSYPPKKFTPQDFSATLRALGLERNATVRATMNASLQTHPGTATHAPAAGVPQAPYGAGVLGSGVQRLAQMWRGLSGQQPPQTEGQGPVAGPPGPATSAPAPHADGQTRRFATLATLRAEQEGAEESKDGRKSNRYYGGNSTEFEEK